MSLNIGLMDEVDRRARNMGVDIAWVLYDCNTDARPTGPIINHAEIADGNLVGGGTCAAAARARGAQEDNPGNSREREREMRPTRSPERESQMPPMRTPELSGTVTTVAVDETRVVEKEESSATTLPAEYPALTDPNPPAYRSRSGTGAAVIENAMFDAFAAFANIGESIKTAALIWAERAGMQKIEQRRRERERQSVFLRRMSSLLLTASDDLALTTAQGDPRVTAAGGPSPQGSIDDAPVHHQETLRGRESANWPLWRWERMFT